MLQAVCPPRWTRPTRLIGTMLRCSLPGSARRFLGTRNPRVRVNCILPSPVMMAAELPEAEKRQAIEATLTNSVSGVATVVYHSIVWQYLSNVDRARFKGVMAAAGQAATHDNPLAWLRFEPAGDVAEVHLRLWPGTKDRLLARSGFHGKPVLWLGRDN